MCKYYNCNYFYFRLNHKIQLRSYLQSFRKTDDFLGVVFLMLINKPDGIFNSHRGIKQKHPALILTKTENTGTQEVRQDSFNPQPDRSCRGNSWKSTWPHVGVCHSFSTIFPSLPNI